MTHPIRITLDGNQFCALQGDDLGDPDSTAGFADTPNDALTPFYQTMIEHLHAGDGQIAFRYSGKQILLTTAWGCFSAYETQADTESIDIFSGASIVGAMTPFWDDIEKWLSENKNNADAAVIVKFLEK